MATELKMDNTTTATTVLTVTPAAVAKISELLVSRNLEGYSLRVFVSGGGCSGLQYGMAIEENAEDFDTKVEVDGISLLVDPNSLPYLQGANIDYIDDIMGGGFRIDNPNAVSSCGCGHSFKTQGSAEGAAGGSCSSCG